jgi:putative flippase GtrA
VGNLLLMRLFVGVAHLQVLPANILSITTCSAVNFLVSDRFVFRLRANVPAADPTE